MLKIPMNIMTKLLLFLIAIWSSLEQMVLEKHAWVFFLNVKILNLFIVYLLRSL